MTSCLTWCIIPPSLWPFKSYLNIPFFWDVFFVTLWKGWTFTYVQNDQAGWPNNHLGREIIIECCNVAFNLDFWVCLKLFYFCKLYETLIFDCSQEETNKFWEFNIWKDTSRIVFDKHFHQILDEVMSYILQQNNWAKFSDQTAPGHPRRFGLVREFPPKVSLIRV